MPQEKLPKQALLAQVKGRKLPYLDDLELDEAITRRIKDGIAWDFTQAK